MLAPCACSLVVLLASRARADSQARLAMTDDEVFARTFGRKADNAPEHVPVMLIVDGRRVGDVLVEVASGTGAVELPVQPVIAAVAGRLRDDIARKLRAAGPRTSIARLRELGLDATYDRRRLELRVAIRPDARPSVIHELQGGVPAAAAEALPPSDTSGYVNVRAGGGAAWSEAEGAYRPPTPFHVNVDGATNLHDWVLEGRVDYVEGPIGLHRGDVRVSRDLVRRALRLTAGDFATASTALQAGFPILGLGVAKNFTLQPYRSVQPANGFEFLLERTSQVTIYVNGAPVRTLSLAAGRHDVRDLPVGSGVSDVTLVIKDDLGTERRLAFRTSSSAALLARGLHQFAYGIGFPLVDDYAGRSYAWATPALSLWHAHGITDHLTIGGRLDAMIDRQIVGEQAVLSTPAGNLGVEVAASRDAQLGIGVATSLRYDYAVSTEGTVATRTLGLSALHRDHSFVAIGPATEPSAYRDQFGASATARLGRTSGGVDVRYEIGGGKQAASAAVRATRTFNNGLGVDLRVGVRRDGDQPNQAEAFATAHWSFPEKRQSLHSFSRASTVEQPTNQLAWNYHSGRATGVAATAALQGSADRYTAAGEVEYTGYRFVTKVGAVTNADGSVVSQATTIELGTAVVFAGGRVAWSRPISGSFALVAPRGAAEDHIVGVNKAGGGYNARADRFGVAVVSNLQPYRVNELQLEAPDLPVGSSLGPNRYALLPTFKSGTLIRVGEDGTVFVRGTLYHADGRAVALAAGELVPVAAQRESKLLMTNRAGRFAIDGVRPGRYVVRVRDLSPISIDIPAGYRGVYSVGPLVDTR